VRPAVVFQNFRIEILDAKAEARHAQLAQRRQLVLLQGARFASNVTSSAPFPRQRGLEAFHEAAQLVALRYDRRAAAEIDVLEPPAADDRLLAVYSTSLTRASMYVSTHGLLVGVDAEVAELAAFPTERNVQVRPAACPRRAARRGRPGVGQIRGLPGGKGG